MTKNLEVLLDSFREEADGEVTSRSRVVDRLLDLRLEAEAAATVALVDRVLQDIPGKTMVPTEWWIEQIEAVSETLDLDESAPTQR